MIAPETRVREQVINVLEAEFGSELDVRDDKIHASLGQQSAVAGVYPSSGEEGIRDVNQQVTYCTVQVFRQWDKKIDPEQTVSPAEIEAYAQRFRKALRASAHPYLGDEGLWFYRVTRIDYPPDPSGNITRFVATIKAWSENAGVTETSA